MGYREIPGFLTQLTDRALDTFMKYRSYRDSRMDKEEDDRYRSFQTMMQLAGSGMATPEQLAESGRGFIPEGTQLRENPAQARTRILSMPEEPIKIPMLPGLAAPINIKGQSDVSRDQLKYAGLELPEDKAEARLRQHVTNVKLAALGGQMPTDDVTAAVSGVPTMSQLQLKRLSDMQPVLENAAGRFVAGAIGKVGGVINPRQMTKLADQAYQEFLDIDRAPGGQGSVTPDMEQHAKSYFYEAVKAAYDDQLDREVRKLAASARYSNQGDDMLRTLDRIVQTQGIQLQNLMSGTSGTIIKALVGRPIEEVPANFREQVNQYNKLKAALDQSMASRNSLAASMGMLPVTPQEVLGEAFRPTGEAPAPSNSEDMEKDRATVALSRAQTEGERKTILNMYKQRTGKDYYTGKPVEQLPTLDEKGKVKRAGPPPFKMPDTTAASDASKRNKKDTP